VTDFNNNNQSDFVIANYGTNNVVVLIDYYVQPSARQTNYQGETSDSTSSVAVGDFNNNDMFDIVFNTGDNILTLIGLGNESFSRGGIFSTGNDSQLQYICIGDLNDDNRMNIVTANKGSDSVGVLLGHGDGNFVDAMTYSTGMGSQPY
jgi:hypothetical protein